jgi:hypothetical protein
MFSEIVIVRDPFKAVTYRNGYKQVNFSEDWVCISEVTWSDVCKQENWYEVSWSEVDYFIRCVLTILLGVLYYGVV